MNQTAGCTVSDLRVALTGTKLDVVDEINIDLRPGEVVGLVGESGSGKTTAGTALLAYSRRGAFIEHGTRDVRGPGRARPALGADPPDPRHEDRLRAAGPGRRAEPGDPDRPPDRRTARAARHRHRRGAHGGRPRGPARGRPARRRRVPGPLPAPALRRPGAARRAGDGVPAQAQGAGARRADHRPGRHHPGHGAEDHGRAVPQPPGRGAVRHARPGRRGQHRRPGRGHVRGPDHRARPARGDVPPARAPLHARAAGRHPAPVAGPRAHRHPGFDAGAGAAPHRVPVQHPLRVRPGPLPGDRAAGRRGRPGPHRAVPARRRDRQLGHQPRQHHRHRPQHRPRDHPDRRGPEGLLRPHGGRARGQLRRGQGRGGRAGRRVRQRQDHDLALRRRAAPAVDGRADVRGQAAGEGLAGPLAPRTASGSSTSSRTRTCR